MVAFFVADAQQRLSLYEEFSGENCGPCAATNPGLWALMNAGTNTSKVLLIKYQVPIPSAGPIYQQNTVDPGARRTYYSVSSAPNGFMDGIVSAQGGHPGYLTQAHIDAAAAVPSSFGLTITPTITGNNISVAVKVDAVSAFTGTNMKLRVALVESLHYATPPGTNGETDFHHVVRKMYSSAAGETIPDTWTSGQTQTFTVTGVIPSYVDRTNEAFIVAWIQSDGDKKIAQAGKSTNLPPASLDGKLTILSPSDGTLLCGGTPDHKVQLKNTGTSAITSAKIHYSVNGSAQTHDWTGNLPAGATADINLGALSITGNATIVDSLGTVNNTDDLNPANNADRSAVAFLSSPASLPMETGFEGGLPQGYLVLDKNNKRVASPAFRGANWFVHTESGIKGPDNSAYTCIASNVDSDPGNTTIVTFPYAETAAGAKAIDFYYAYAKRGNIGDKLEVVYSTDCGATWTSVWSKAGDDLATAPATPENQLFIPNGPAQWKSASVDVTAVTGNALIGFRATSSGGNLNFIDQIKLRTGPTSVTELVSGGLVNVYPNPVQDYVNVELNMVSAAKVSFTIVNLLGQQMGGAIDASLSQGQAVTKLSTDNLAPGIYFINVNTEKGSLQQKFVKK